MKIFVWSFIFVSFAARADFYNVQCSAFSRIFKVEVTLSYRPVLEDPPVKPDSSDYARLGIIKNNSPITLQLNELVYKSSDRPALAYVDRKSLANGSDILMETWSKKGPSALYGRDFAISLEDQATFPMTLRVRIGNTGEMTALDLNVDINGVRQACWMAKDKSAESEALINAPTPMQ
jgi:hypothetical protein